MILGTLEAQVLALGFLDQVPSWRISAQAPAGEEIEESFPRQSSGLVSLRRLSGRDWLQRALANSNTHGFSLLPGKPVSKNNAVSVAA